MTWKINEFELDIADRDCNYFFFCLERVFFLVLVIFHYIRNSMFSYQLFCKRLTLRYVQVVWNFEKSSYLEKNTKKNVSIRFYGKERNWCIVNIKKVGWQKPFDGPFAL